ncbi:nucleotidyltransferase family protein [Agaribacterium sp. ZY112]|uniref:nucleotidyltransferase family protein n=1 Tax=Agaribacterium sp. ZY112 TaxID=3233574 RepID=UPI0035266066
MKTSITSQDRLSFLLKQDKIRMSALELVRSLQLPQAYIAAGFLRNLAWDATHKKSQASKLNDIDVVYFCPDTTNEHNKDIETRLTKQLTSVRWQVKNQALMHINNGDRPYRDVIDAMSFWPEQETAVAVRLLEDGSFEFISAFSLDALFELSVTYNPVRSIACFNERISQKQWLQQWPLLTVNYGQYTNQSE